MLSVKLLKTTTNGTASKKSNEIHPKCICTFSIHLFTLFFLLQLILTYMKRILHLVPVKNFIFMSSYNWFKIDFLRLLQCSYCWQPSKIHFSTANLRSGGARVHERNALGRRHQKSRPAGEIQRDHHFSVIYYLREPVQNYLADFFR